MNDRHTRQVFFSRRLERSMRWTVSRPSPAAASVRAWKTERWATTTVLRMVHTTTKKHPQTVSMQVYMRPYCATWGTTMIRPDVRQLSHDEFILEAAWWGGFVPFVHERMASRAGVVGEARTLAYSDAAAFAIASN